MFDWMTNALIQFLFIFIVIWIFLEIIWRLIKRIRKLRKEFKDGSD